MLIIIIINNNKLYQFKANLGDSRAVICKDGKSFFCTEDSDWTNPRGIKYINNFIFNFLTLNYFIELNRLGINKDNQSYIIKTKSGEKKKFILNGNYLNGIFIITYDYDYR